VACHTVPGSARALFSDGCSLRASWPAGRGLAEVPSGCNTWGAALAEHVWKVVAAGADEAPGWTRGHAVDDADVGRGPDGGPRRRVL